MLPREKRQGNWSRGGPDTEAVGKGKRFFQGNLHGKYVRSERRSAPGSGAII